MFDLTPLQQYFKEKNPACELKYNEPMSLRTSFRIGGSAEVMAFPKTQDQLAEILKLSKVLDCKCAILGAGTNVLAPDEGVPGVVICLKDCMDGIELLENDRIHVMAGVTMTRAAVFAANKGLSGLEFAHGIPGTVGGGVYMNAGAYGGEICQVCESVEVIDKNGNLRQLTGGEMAFSYRHSILEETGYIVTSVIFKLTPRPVDQIRARMKELMDKRSASQPLDLPSAGSAFKRPAQGYAAALIDEAGLKGYQVGNAAISTKHAGFAVNLGGATAADVRLLLQQVSDKVFDKTGIRLEPEVRIW
jgi:UDP-N-acetylmuramate dehydrogenase